eukprot:SAG11_NODE_22719_length_401_cov_0.850993_2_plen_33_part_01
MSRTCHYYANTTALVVMPYANAIEFRPVTVECS